MTQALSDQRWVFNTGNNSELAAAFRASLDVDSEHPLEPLHPTHGRYGLVTFHRALRSLRHDAITVLEVRGEHPVKASEVQSRAWGPCGQAGDEVQRARPAPGLTAPGTSTQVEPRFLVPGWGPRQGVVQRFALLNMLQDLGD